MYLLVKKSNMVKKSSQKEGLVKFTNKRPFLTEKPTFYRVRVVVMKAI
jgi:hypothetical protein